MFIYIGLYAKLSKITVKKKIYFVTFRIKTTDIQEGLKLTISKAKQNDEGTYVCQALSIPDGTIQMSESVKLTID